MQRGLTKARLTVAIENNGAGVHILRRSISHGRPTQTSVVQQQQKRRKCQGGPKDFARVPWVYGSWRRRMTGAIAKGYCALQWDFTVKLQRHLDGPEVPSFHADRNLIASVGGFSLVSGRLGVPCRRPMGGGSGRPRGGIAPARKDFHVETVSGRDPASGFCGSPFEKAGRGEMEQGRERDDASATWATAATERSTERTAGRAVQRGVVGAWMAAWSCLPRSLCEPRVHRKSMHGP